MSTLFDNILVVYGPTELEQSRGTKRRGFNRTLYILFLDNSLPDDAHLFNTENSGKYTSTRRDTSGEYELIVVLRQTHLRYPVVNGVPMVHGVDDLSPDRQPSCCGYISNSVEEFTSEMQMSMFLS